MEVKIGFIMGPSPVNIGKVYVEKGDSVKTGDILLEYESGKGVVPVNASVDGIVTKVLCTQGDKVNADDILFELDNISIDEVSEKRVTDDIKESNITCELLVIGAGPGGYVAAIHAAQCGIDTVIVEKNDMGGTCLNVGCIPTKVFVKTANLFHEIEESDLYGINVDEYDVDFPQVIQRKNSVRDQLKDGVDALLCKNGVKVLKGTATFCSEKQVDVVSNESINHVNAKNIIIATGSKISKLNIKGIDLPVVLNSSSALDLDKLPDSITIVGGGVIGMEFASIFSSLGVKVHVVEFLDRVLSMVDEDISQEIQKMLHDDKLNIHTSSKVMSIEESIDGQAIVTFQKNEEIFKITSEKVLIAIGREPNIDNLELENAGIKLYENKKGIEVDSHMKTNVPNIYAIGDASNVIQLAHVASHQGTCAVNNILGKNEEMDYSIVPNVIFTRPEVASVGITELECKSQQLTYKIAKFPYYANGKALIMNEEKGFIKLIQDNSSKKIIGASIIGPDADTAINILTFAISFGLTDSDISKVIFPHPTTSEVIHECALSLSNKAIHLHKDDIKISC